MAAKSLEACVCRSVRGAARALTHYYEAELQKAGLTFTQFSLLAQIAARKDATMAQIAARQGLDPSTLSRTLKPLEKAGFAAIHADAGNRRVRRVHLTATGGRKLMEAGARWLAAQKAAASALPPSLIAQLTTGANGLSVD